jgi:hypothetical protein
VKSIDELLSTAWRVDDVIDFSGSATDPQDRTLPASALSWSLIMHYCSAEGSCHEQPLGNFDGVASDSFSASDHEYPSYLELRLTATDSLGSQDIESMRLYPQTVELTFRSRPSGLQRVVGNNVVTTPFSRTVIVGSTNSVSATSPQTLPDTTYAFGSWSDSETQSHDTVAGDEPITYTTTYTPDTTPTISALSLTPGSRIKNRRPTIKATVKDEQTNLMEENLTLVVDGQTIEDSAFAYNETKNRLSYTPEAKIKSGKHGENNDSRLTGNRQDKNLELQGAVRSATHRQRATYVTAATVHSPLNRSSNISKLTCGRWVSRCNFFKDLFTENRVLGAVRSCVLRFGPCENI